MALLSSGLTALRFGQELVEGLDQNKDFYTMLLNQPDMKHELIDMFLSDIYQSYQAGVAK